MSTTLKGKKSADMTEADIEQAKAELDASMRGDQVARVSLFSKDELAEIGGFEDAMRLLASKGVAVESVADYGTGFRLVPDRDNGNLVGIPFALLDWQFNPGAFGPRGFVSVQIVTKGGDKLILNDGSTGICQQLHDVTDKRTAAGESNAQYGLYAPKGLVHSGYFYNEKSGEISKTPREGDGWIKAGTFYLSE